MFAGSSGLTNRSSQRPRAVQIQRICHDTLPWLILFSLGLMHLAIRQAAVGDIPVISDILLEAAHWLQRQGASMWRDDEVAPECIASDVAVGSFYLAESAGEAIGTLKFQLSDSVFWPDVPTDESAFIHRVAVRRRFSGGTVSSALLGWAAERAHALGRRFLRLDCEASRLRLRAVYERFGFLHHSDRQVGPYFVSRYELPLPRLRPNQTMERTVDRCTLRF
jgi:GNAT superfamily N-acetyltransferase